MHSLDILYRLERVHGIRLTTETIDGVIYVDVECDYWMNKKQRLATGHSAKDYTALDAKLYFIPKVLGMAGLKISETLEHI